MCLGSANLQLLNIKQKLNLICNDKIRPLSAMMSASIFSTICLETKKLLIAKNEICLMLRSFNKRKAHVLKVDIYFYIPQTVF